MSHPTLEPDPSAPRPNDGGLAASIAPEAVAGVLSVIVVVALLTARLAFAGSSTATPRPSATAQPTAVPTATPPQVDTVAIRTLLQVDGYLLEQARDLETELKTPPVNTRNIQYAMSQISIQLFQGRPAAQRLTGTPGGATLGPELAALYAELAQTMDLANDVSLQVEPTWRANAAAVVATLARLPALDDQLAQLLTAGPGPSGSVAPSVGPTTEPSPSVSPSAPPSATPPVATPTPPPTPSPTPTATPPATIVPTPSPGPNPLVDPGFEAGVGSPWVLAVSDTAASATVSADSASRHGGGLSARIDIAVPSNKRAGIALQQGGLTIEAAGIYRVSLWARSTTTREIRVRITTAAGQTLGNGTNLFTIGPDWAPLTFDVSSILGSDSAVLAIEVGQGGEPVWVDDTSIVRIPPGSP
jgi:hypothetical protein